MKIIKENKLIVKVCKNVILFVLTLECGHKVIVLFCFVLVKLLTMKAHTPGPFSTVHLCGQNTDQSPGISLNAAGLMVKRLIFPLLFRGLRNIIKLLNVSI